MLTNLLLLTRFLKWAALPVLCVGVYAIYRRMKKTPKENVQPPKEEARSDAQSRIPQPPAPTPDRTASQREALADEYCRVCRALDQYRDRELYRDLFIKIGPFVQLLIGSARCFRKGENTADLLQELQIQAENSRLANMLTPDRFLVETTPSEYNEESLRRLCQNAELSAIRMEIEKKNRWLQQYRSFWDAGKALTAVAPLLYGILLDVQSKNARECFEKVEELQRILEEHGCYAIFWEDSRVKNSEAMRVDFREDSSWATELPGLYTRNNKGEYQRIGTLCGTVRRG